MNISYDLWPIWCDYLEEQGQNTELLRYVMQYQCWNNLSILCIDFKNTKYGYIHIIIYDNNGLGFNNANFSYYGIPYLGDSSSQNGGSGTYAYKN